MTNNPSPLFVTSSLHSFPPILTCTFKLRLCAFSGIRIFIKPSLSTSSRLKMRLVWKSDICDTCRMRKVKVRYRLTWKFAVIDIYSVIGNIRSAANAPSLRITVIVAIRRVKWSIFLDQNLHRRVACTKPNFCRCFWQISCRHTLPDVKHFLTSRICLNMITKMATSISALLHLAWYIWVKFTAMRTWYTGVCNAISSCLKGPLRMPLENPQKI